MAQNDRPNPQPRGLSSFANLLGSNAGTISSAPVMYNQQPGSDDAQLDATAAKKQQMPPALRFQPTKRPQIASQKKAKTAFPKPARGVESSSSPDPASKTAAAPRIAALAANPPSKTTLADWTADDDDVNGFYAATQSKPRGGRKKRKKKQQEEEQLEPSWDDIYDPTRPNDYNQYKSSEEQMREIAEWKELLYRHRNKDRDDASSDGEDYSRARMKTQFAPPKNLNFAPPPDLHGPSGPVTSAPVEVPDDPTGEDAYARRLRLSGMAAPPPPQLEDEPEQMSPRPTAATTTLPPALSAPVPAGTIARAPVRYSLPSAPADLPSTEAELEDIMNKEAALDEQQESEDAPRSKVPGQRGFAQRIMEKYGWQKGKGLGAKESGIITPLAMKAEKRKKLSDAKGGGWATPGGMGKIVGGKKAEGAEEEGKHGKMSQVVVMLHMVDGLDLEKELQEGMLMQEIGEECGEKYGRVERVYINQHTMADTVPVFVKFTNELSALRAVNALDGRIFNGNKIRARYFDTDKFERGDYEVVMPEDKDKDEK